MQGPTIMVDERFCLRVRNLPAVLSTDAVTSLLSHYGAVRVRVLHRRSISSGREPGAVPSIKTQKAIAVFKSREAQQNAQRRLHNLELAGQHLHVQVVGDDEESKDSVELKLNNADVAAKLPLNGPPPLPKGLPPPLPPTTVHASMQNSLYPPAPAPLAPHLGLNYAPSPLLEYKYPKATESIVRNIANALIALPRFYTQVLHLMNKMNLPPPFEEDAILGRFSKSQETIKQEDELINQRRRQLKRPRNEKSPDFQIVEAEDEEEEQGSIDVDAHDQIPPTTTNPSSASFQTFEPINSRQVKGATDNNTSEEMEGHRTSDDPGPRPLIIGKSLVRQNKRSLTKNSTPTQAFQLGVNKENHDEACRSTRPGIISEAELNRQRRKREDLMMEQCMRSYERGLPSPVVLVQNIAATVDEKDLRSIFGYVLPLDVDLDSMEITFLPAKGSALVRYSDTEIATAAVDKLLGFQIEGNPLVIVRYVSCAMLRSRFLAILKTFQKAETSENIVSNDDIIKPTTLRWTTQDLANKRMPELQLSGEKVMKKYERGESSDTLYVKNLAKSVEFADLAAVFGACLPPDSTPEALDIRHFTTGRMKCQAFVKYPTVDLASNALHQVHGVVLKDKPLIVCFRKPQTNQN